MGLITSCIVLNFLNLAPDYYSTFYDKKKKHPHIFAHFVVVLP